MPMNGHKIDLQAVCGLFSRKIPSRSKNSGNVSMKNGMQTVLCQMPTICTAEEIMPWTKKQGFVDTIIMGRDQKGTR